MPGPSCPYLSDRPLSGHCLGRCLASHAHILHLGLCLVIGEAHHASILQIVYCLASSQALYIHILQVDVHLAISYLGRCWASHAHIHIPQLE